MLPSQDDYVETDLPLFEILQQGRSEQRKRGRPSAYTDKALIVFFPMMLIKRITAVKAQHRWLVNHPVEVRRFGFETVPHRTTLSRRFRQLYATIQEFTIFIWPLPPRQMSNILSVFN